VTQPVMDWQMCWHVPRHLEVAQRIHVLWHMQILSRCL
jgi:hypothetical protein